MNARSLRFLTTAALAASLFLAPGPAAAQRPQADAATRPAVFVLDLSAGPIVGMDRPLRGGALGLGAGVAAGRLSASLRVGGSYDVSLAAFVADAGLALGLGDGIRLVVGGELPLGAPSLASGGSRWPVAAAPWPSRFALAVPIARLSGGGGARPAATMEAELSYSAYRVAAGGAGAPAEIAAGIAGFAAGFRALVGLRLSWQTRPR